jgi:hypothetical protein
VTPASIGILGVHGVHNYQDGLSPAEAAERLAGWWGDAVRSGLRLATGASPISVDVAYYAHHLRAGTAHGDDDPGLLEPEVQQMIVSWARLLGAPEAVTQGRVFVPAREAVSWIADRFGLDHKPARILAAALFRELGRYFTDPAAREASRAEVAEAIARSRPRVIIAHSLGSVVAYEALWAHDPAPIELLLTLGSPLAMPDLVYERLAPHPGARARPPAVNRWINVADPGDVIAVPPGGIPRRFADVNADLDDAIGTFSYHRVTNYLRCGVVSGVLSAYL